MSTWTTSRNAGRRPGENQAPPELLALVAACDRERVRRAPSAALSDFSGIPAARLLGEEKGRIDQLRREQEEREAAYERLKDDPGTRQVAYSAAICRANAVRAAAKREIDMEFRYAAQGGDIVDKQKLYDLQQQLRAADEEIKAGAQALNDLHRKLVPCEAAAVIRVRYCLGVDAGEQPSAPEGPDFDCDSLELRAAREVVREQ